MDVLHSQPRHKRRRPWLSCLLASSLAVSGSLLSVGLPDALADEPELAAFHTSFESDDLQLEDSSRSIAASGVVQSGNSEVPGMQTVLGGGPTESWTSAPNVGFTGVHSLHYSGEQLTGHGVARNHLFDVNIPVTADTRLTYKIFPAQMSSNMEEALPSASTYVALNVTFADGSTLGDLASTDQYHFPLTAAGQGDAKTLIPNFWNDVQSNIGEVAAGRTITSIVLDYDNADTGAGPFEGWLDDIVITDEALAVPEHLADWVSTTRGTDSNRDFSRGNTFPATAVPHGFNFWTPVTDAGTTAFLYQYRENNNEENLTELQAISLSHQGYPWGGERHVWQVMPTMGEGVPNPDRDARALAFSHDNEIDKPHYYGVTGENGLHIEVTPTNRAAMMRFTFPDGVGNLIFDNVNNQGGLTLHPEDSAISGYTLSGESRGFPKFFYATFDQPVAASGKLSESARPDVTGYVQFDANVVNMRVATSLISVEQAQHNLDLEIPEGTAFETVMSSARDLWNDALGVITDVEGASHDQLVGLYSDLYRLNLYPHTAFENRGTVASPEYVHASMWAEPAGSNSATETGAQIIEGEAYRTTNFWDTYRTAWPAHVLFYPDKAAEMLDGALTQFEELGWLATTMVGTNSDVTIADAVSKGVVDFDIETAYAALIRNATVAPPRGDWVGRAGLHEGLFRGYTPISTREGFAESMENYLNDFGIAQLATYMAENAEPGSDEHERYLTDAVYFTSRAQNYVNLFDEEADFFQGRRSNGEWRVPAEEYDPRVWGNDYTETNGWGMAFSVPHDGQGLANLYGGREALEAKLDEFFATPETATLPGSYGNVIHEMYEAAYLQMGQWGMSNQPAHHISYMYNYAGAPHKAQAMTREALSRAFVGNQIGQGYPGDEDTGEMSMWYVFGALGFYPLQVGSDQYTIGSPLFQSATVNLPSGNQIVIEAPNNSRENIYVQGLQVNGQEYGNTTISHEVLSSGATLRFDMGSEPSFWGTGEDAAPPSITEGEEIPNPLRDLTGVSYGSGSSSEGDVVALFDDTSVTEKAFATNNPSVTFSFAGGGERMAGFYTLTSGAQTGDPTGWDLEGSLDGENWTTLDIRSDESFEWRLQTRVFRIEDPSSYSHYRLNFTADGATSLAEVELLGVDDDIDSDLSIDLVPGRTLVQPSEVDVEREFVLDVSDVAPAGTDVTIETVGPEGWIVEPASAKLSLEADGDVASGHLPISVTVPAGTLHGIYTVAAVVTAPGANPVRVAATVEVTDLITFTPATGAEELWLWRDDNSQVDGVGNRFVDGGSSFTYRFDLPRESEYALATIEIDNQYLVEASADGVTWTEILREESEIRDGSNWGAYEVDLAPWLGDDGVVFLRFSDSFPSDGWGGRLNRVTINLAEVPLPNPIEFATSTADETRWLYENVGAKVDNVGNRYVDNAAYFTYLFPLPAGTQAATATVVIDNQYLVEISPDGEDWIEVLREEREIRDGSNYGEQEFDLSPGIGEDGRVFMRVSDSYPNDGWGARLSHVVVAWEEVESPEPTEEPSPEPTDEPSPEPTDEPTSEPSPDPSEDPVPEPTPSVPGGFVPTPPYTKPGLAVVNGRQWSTTCEPYSQTVRCRAEIWASVVTRTGDTYTIERGWAFNNLTYLPMMKRAQWSQNPLGFSGQWTSTDGSRWRTECDTPLTGGDGCRSFRWTTVYQATPLAGGGYSFGQENQWVFNNIVMFRPN